MKEIQSVNVIGMGALGLLYANLIQSNVGAESVSFLLDDQRYGKYKDTVFTINGEQKTFQMVKESQAVPEKIGDSTLPLVDLKAPQSSYQTPLSLIFILLHLL